MKIASIATVCGLLLATIAPPYQAFAQQRTAAECRAEWRANRAENQAAGITERAFVAQCRRGETPAAPAQAAPRGAAPGADATAQPAPARRGATATGAGKFATEAEAKAHCPGDTVVWANTKTRVYHFSGNKAFGTTKAGAFMCEGDTAAAGIRAAKNEKHP